MCPRQREKPRFSQYSFAVRMEIFGAAVVLVRLLAIMSRSGALHNYRTYRMSMIAIDPV